MAKLKVGKGRDGTNKSKKKKKVVEEITLSSGSEASDSEHSEAESSNSDVMEVDAEKNGNADCNGTAAEDEMDNDKPADSDTENKTNDVDEQQKSSKLSEENITDENCAAAETKESMNNSENTNGHQEASEKELNVNLQSDHIMCETSYFCFCFKLFGEFFTTEKCINIIFDVILFYFGFLFLHLFGLTLNKNLSLECTFWQSSAPISLSLVRPSCPE